MFDTSLTFFVHLFTLFMPFSSLKHPIIIKNHRKNSKNYHKINLAHRFSAWDVDFHLGTSIFISGRRFSAWDVDFQLGTLIFCLGRRCSAWDVDFQLGMSMFGLGHQQTILKSSRMCLKSSQDDRRINKCSLKVINKSGHQIR